MEIEELAKEVEAVLFAAGRKVSIEELKGLCKEQDAEKLKKAASLVKKKLDDNESPLLLTEESDGYKLTVREKFLPLVQQIIPETELGRSILETLAVIAWKQPILQSKVIDIRTSKAYEHIGELEELGFVNKEKKGRSFVLKTTQKFAEYFDVPTQEKIKEIFKEVEQKAGKEPAGEAGDELKLKLGKLDVYEEEQQKAQAEAKEAPEEAEGEIEIPLEAAEKGESEEEPPEEKKEQFTEDEFEEAEEAPEEESALGLFQDEEQEVPKKKKPIEEETYEQETEEEEQEESEEKEEKKDKEEERKLPEQLEGILKTDQPDFLHPKEDIEQIEEEVEESDEIQEEEKEVEEERKEMKKESIKIPKPKIKDEN